VKKLEGLTASRGIVIGPVFCMADETPASIPRVKIDARDADAQWARFEAALKVSREELQLLKSDRGREQSDIIEAQLMMLDDPEFIPQIRKAFTNSLTNIEAVLKDKIDEAAGMLRTTGDPYLAERAVDIEDSFGRVMGHLLSDAKGAKGSARSGAQSTHFVPPGTIIAARNIKPSDAMGLRDTGIAGIVLEEGGATSHVAILARTWKIPAVMGVRGLLDALADGEVIVLDAVDGLVITGPDKNTVEAYRTRLRSDIRQRAETAMERAELLASRAETTDGAILSLKANIASADEALAAREEGAEGVGLFRSEFLFLASDILPDEETQFDAYRTACENMAGRPVIIRTLDAGADKMIGEQTALEEKNPLLGWRAVRFCLDRREMFKVQLRALLRASVHGDLRIMFPMISNVEELDSVLEVLEEAKAECARDGFPFNARMKVGIMVEIPAAAVCADLLAQKSDFMSIGTNDLIQYTMAVDRENPKVARLYDCYNPAVLRLVRQTIDAGKAARVEVSMCGEMAGDPASVFLLMGLGLRSFSMAPALISQVKELVRKVSLADAVELADAAMEMSSSREIRKLVQEKLKAYE
jgi:phosphotransferase system enzyme I (PtsI)